MGVLIYKEGIGEKLKLTDSDEFREDEEYKNQCKREIILFYWGIDKIKYKHYYSEISDFVYEAKSESVEYLIEWLGEIKDKNEQKLQALNKLYDHLILEKTRKERTDKEFREYEKKLIMAENKLKETISKNKIAQSEIENKYKKIEKNLEKHSIDVIGVTTLIFTAFTIISVNASIFAGSYEKFETIYNVIGVMAATNIILIISVYTIYSIMRKIHGDIEENRLKKILDFSIFSLIMVLITTYILSIIIG
ncbi:hypothetical protein [Miniphocaeibacter massiliensis]|uniref:hypothetical protein n=1 Tax=Miniphocaeibacter massiliensis TaxID=2041841 RepID=UPI000C1BEC66|nr:hypothetical protein [Miniphocaeibacter massiliensis]